MDRSDPNLKSLSKECREAIKKDRKESNRGPPVIASPIGMEIPPPFLPGEVRAAIRSFAIGKAAGDDKITADFLRSCHDNVILLLTRLIEVGREYQKPLTLVFIYFHKAFDSVEPHAIWESLKSQGVQPAYIVILQQCYTNCPTTITPFHKKVKSRSQEVYAKETPSLRASSQAV
uniref:Reverse transcriptase domain-containing protein n=2 Tax=Caenorhabditis japonica TaxID=281687 RepID=A0A8R1ESA1_CAEJA